VGTSGGGNHPHFSLRGNFFCIKHYAGDVNYDIVGMVTKNKDALYKDLLDVTAMSNNNLLAQLFPEARTGGADSKPTTSTKVEAWGGGAGDVA
jgi:myosin heavy subunit